MPNSAPPPPVLIVDDDEGMRILMQEALVEQGQAVMLAASGAEALRRLEEQKPALMLLDLKLQDMGGQTLLKQLMKAHARVPFIIITGQGDERVAVEMMKQGALDYLVKDAGMIDRLPAVVNRALEQLARDKELAAARAALAESEKRILEISERERQHLGAELHDGLGQQLTAIELMCQSLKDDLRSTHRQLEGQAAGICQHLRDAVAQTRAIARGLSPVNLEADGLSEALRELAHHTNELRKVKCTFEYPAPVEVRNGTVASHLFRIAQEAVNNALKHARASIITITLAREDHQLRLEIADNGRGIAKSKKSPGIGLNVMKHRTDMIGATLEIRSQPGKGTAVVCTLGARKI